MTTNRIHHDLAADGGPSGDRGPRAARVRHRVSPRTCAPVLAIATLTLGGSLGATGVAHAGGGSYGDLVYCTVTSLTIDIDGSWAAPYESRPITSVDVIANAGPYASMSGSANPSPTANGYSYFASSQTLPVAPFTTKDFLSAQTNFYNLYPNDQDPYPTIKNGFIEYVLDITTPVTIALFGDGTSGGVVQPGLVVTVDGTSIADGDTLAVGTRTLRYTWTDYGQVNNQFRMWVELNAVPTAVPGGTGALCLLAVSGVGRRRRRRD